MTNTKILFIITQADGGGAQRYTLSLAKYFHGQIAAGTENNQLFEEANKLGITTYPLNHLKRNINPWHDMLSFFQIYNLVKKTKPDIVHLNSTKAGVIGSVAAKLAGSKVIFTAHGFRFLEPLSPTSRYLYLCLEKIASYFRDFTITVSDFDRHAALENKITNENKITTIHNGLKTLEFLPALSARLNLKLNKDQFIFGTIANLYHTKGLDVLVEAIAMLPKVSLKKTQWVIIGFGDQAIHSNLTKLINKHDLTNSVKLLGKIENGFRYLKAFNAYVLPSRKEGFPYALLEAAQAGLPIVATKVGGIPEAFEGEVLLVEPENPYALSQAMHMVIADEQTRNDLSKKSLERSKEFTETKMLEQTEKVYEKVIKK